MPDVVASMKRFEPELILTGALLLVVLADATGARWRDVVSRILTIGGLVLALVRSVELRGGSAEIFGGMAVIDPLASFFEALLIGASLLVILAFTFRNSRELHGLGQGEFYSLMLAVTLSNILLATANDLAMLYLALEMVSITSYVMVAYMKGDRMSNEASLKYILFGAVSTGAMLYGLSFLYGLTGTTSLPAIREFLATGVTDSNRFAIYAIALLVFAGFGFKTATVPFHFWCPDVYQGAPTPFTAFLSVGPKAAGFAVAIRFFFAAFEKQLPGGGYQAATDLPWPAIIGIISAITMTLGNLTAIVQTNLKRLLAYSSIAHAGYLLMGLAAASAAGVQSILVYLIIYVLMNVGAFLVIIVVSRVTGGEEIEDLRGLGTKAPIAALALTVFLFSLTGIPPFAGFIGKWLIFAAVVQQGGFWYVLLAVIGALNSAVSLFYYARIIKAMYLEDATDERPLAVPAVYTGVLVALAVPVFVLGVYWTPLVRWASAAFGGVNAS